MREKNTLAVPLPEAPSIPTLVQSLLPYFLSSSLGQPPGAPEAATGNRTVVVTTKSAQATVKPQDSTKQALVAGTLTWTFATKFAAPPVVVYAVEGIPPSTSTLLYTSTISATSITVVSTTNTDTRTLDLFAVGNPS